MGLSETTLKIITTFWLATSYFEASVGLFILGPTILDIRDQTHVSQGTTSWIFLIFGLGMMMGMALNVVFKRFDGTLLLGLSCLTASTGTLTAGWSQNFLLTNFGFLFLGISIGIIDTVVIFICKEMWAEYAAAVFQGATATMALGALSAGFIGDRFSAYSVQYSHQKQARNESISVTQPMNISALLAGPITSFSSKHISRLNLNQLDAPAHSSQANHFVGPAYTVLSALFLLTALYLVSYYIYRHYWRPQAKMYKMIGTKNGQKTSHGFVDYALHTSLIFLSTGQQNVLGNLLPLYAYRTFGAENPYLSTVLWCGFLVARLGSAYLSTNTRLGCRNVLLISLSIGTVGSLTFVLTYGNFVMLFVSVAILSLGLGPIFPASTSWAMESLDIAELGLSIIFIISAFGHAGLGAVGTYILSAVSPYYFGLFVFLMTICILLSTVILSVMKYYSNIRKDPKEEYDA